MEGKDQKNGGDFFSKKTNIPNDDVQKHWDEIFSGWIDRLDQEDQILNLFELRLWLDSLEAFFHSGYLENMAFKFQPPSERSYDFYFFTFHQVIGRIIALLKELDFKKDKFFLNFEEFIVEKILEDSTTSPLPYLKEFLSPESWFNNFRIFLQNLKNLTADILHSSSISQRTFASTKKLYHKELIGNPILITLLKKPFIPKVDRIAQLDISGTIASIKDKNLKKTLGIFFVLGYKILKINYFIESNLNRSKYLEMTIPLLLTLNTNFENIMAYSSNILLKNLKETIKDSEKMNEVNEVLKNLKPEFKKISEGELPLYFDAATDKNRRRNLIKNIVLISEVTIQELIEKVARLFNPAVSGSNIFENYISRKQKSAEMKKKLFKLHTKINDFFGKKGNIAPSEIFFDINYFMETDLHYMPYREWNEFISHYNNLNLTNLPSEFDSSLRIFHSFLIRMLKETGAA